MDCYKNSKINWCFSPVRISPCDLCFISGRNISIPSSQDSLFPGNVTGMCCTEREVAANICQLRLRRIMNDGPGLLLLSTWCLLSPSLTTENWAKKWWGKGKNKVKPAFNVKVWRATKSQIQFASQRMLAGAGLLVATGKTKDKKIISSIF